MGHLGGSAERMDSGASGWGMGPERQLFLFLPSSFFFFVGSVGGWRLEVESGCGCEVDGDLKV